MIRPAPPAERSAAARWAACFLVVASAHGLAGAALLARDTPLSAPEAPEAAIMIDLPPELAMPTAETVESIASEAATEVPPAETNQETDVADAAAEPPPPPNAAEALADLEEAEAVPEPVEAEPTTEATQTATLLPEATEALAVPTETATLLPEASEPLAAPTETAETQPPAVDAATAAAATAASITPDEAVETIIDPADLVPPPELAEALEPDVPMALQTPPEVAAEAPAETAPEAITEAVEVDRPMEVAVADFEAPTPPIDRVPTPTPRRDIQREERKRPDAPGRVAKKPPTEAPAKKPPAEAPAKKPAARTPAKKPAAEAPAKRPRASERQAGAPAVAGRRASGAGRPDKNSLARFMSSVRADIMRQRRSVRVKGRGRTATVRFTITASGALRGIGLVASSGVPELDAEALALVRRASPVPAIPAAVGQSQVTTQLPVLLN